jgi:hypothetical protein
MSGRVEGMQVDHLVQQRSTAIDVHTRGFRRTFGTPSPCREAVHTMYRLPASSYGSRGKGSDGHGAGIVPSGNAYGLVRASRRIPFLNRASQVRILPGAPS